MHPVEEKKEGKIANSVDILGNLVEQTVDLLP